MLLFFKQLTTNQYMDQQELYQQNWCSIVGGVLDWMLFFFKCPTTSQYMDDGQCYPKNNTNQKWCSIVRGLDGCYSFSNIQQLHSTWILLGLVVVSLWYCVVVLLCQCCCVVVMYFSPRCIKMECGNSEKHASIIHITSVIM